MIRAPILRATDGIAAFCSVAQSRPCICLSRCSVIWFSLCLCQRVESEKRQTGGDERPDGRRIPIHPDHEKWPKRCRDSPFGAEHIGSAGVDMGEGTRARRGRGESESALTPQAPCVGCQFGRCFPTCLPFWPLCACCFGVLCCVLSVGVLWRPASCAVPARGCGCKRRELRARVACAGTGRCGEAREYSRATRVTPRQELFA